MSDKTRTLDWIDKEYQDRQRGIKRALSQDQHSRVNSRYPDCTEERCVQCDNFTGRAGRGDDSLFTTEGGPYCEDCYDG